METNLPEEVRELFKKFKEKNYQLFLVGGVVRDLLLKKEIKDWDFTTDATPEQILDVIPDGFYNNKFGTVGLNTEGLGVFEITTMRKEGEYKDSRHPEQVSWTNKVEEDLARRDFTINAIAMGLNSSSSPQGRTIIPVLSEVEVFFERSREVPFILIDPFKGQADLEQKIIKAVGDPGKRFQEDALRLLRAVRFSTQFQFLIEERTFEAIKQNAKLILNISWERIRDEIFKILSTDFPYEGIVMLRNAGLLEYILPEVEKCFGIVQQGPKHDRVYDIGEHSLLSLKFCPSKDPLVRFASLIHDTGKFDTVKTSPDGNVTFYGHDIVGGKIAKKIGERFRFSSKEIDKLYRLVRYHMFTVSEYQTDSAIRRFIKNVGLENIDDMMAVRVGDRLGGGTQTETSWRMEEFKKRIGQVLQKPFSISDLKITGTQVMEITNLKPGPKVGEILNQLFKEVLEDAEKNNKEYLKKRTEELMA